MKPLMPLCYGDGCKDRDKCSRYLENDTLGNFREHLEHNIHHGQTHCIFFEERKRDGSVGRV